MNHGEFEGLEAVILGVLGFLIFIALIVTAITIIGMWKTLEKGNKPGWGSLIPFYNIYLVCEMVGVNPWWILIVALSPILNIVPLIGTLAQFAVVVYFTILLNVSLARAFKKEDGFAAGLILLPPVFYLILGFGKDEYVGKKPMKDIVFETINDNINKDSNVKEAQYEENVKYCSSCGKKVEVDTKYCPKCGKEL